MLFRKKGFPEENELVMCNVTQVLHNSVFAELLDYGRQGMIHISEVSPGRIRNIRDYVKVGKVIVCKVLRVNQVKGYIDLSLRRVSEGQRRQKVNEVKQEQLAEKILEYTAKQHNLKLEDLYNKVASVVFKDYDQIHHFFEDVVAEIETIDKFGLDKAVAKTLLETIKQRIKPKIYTLRAEVILSTFEGDGVEIIKKILTDASKDNALIYYKGGGKYIVELSGDDIKEIKKKIITILEKDIVEKMEKYGTAEFQMIEDKK